LGELRSDVVFGRARAGLLADDEVATVAVGVPSVGFIDSAVERFT
jgi:hypothetical protein